jgi:2,3-bisphosphoglycerate-independent phosphoglycerate mutase
MRHCLVRRLMRDADSEIISLVLDALVCTESDVYGHCALETGSTPSLDRLAGQGMCGLHQAIGTGLALGNRPSHPAQLACDPPEYRPGRGIPGALGIDPKLRPMTSPTETPYVR